MCQCHLSSRQILRCGKFQSCWLRGGLRWLPLASWRLTTASLADLSRNRPWCGFWAPCHCLWSCLLVLYFPFSQQSSSCSSSSSSSPSCWCCWLVADAGFFFRGVIVCLIHVVIQAACGFKDWPSSFTSGSSASLSTKSAQHQVRTMWSSVLQLHVVLPPLSTALARADNFDKRPCRSKVVLTNPGLDQTWRGVPWWVCPISAWYPFGRQVQLVPTMPEIQDSGWKNNERPVNVS